MEEWIYLKKKGGDLPNTPENREIFLSIYRTYNKLTEFDYTRFISWLKYDFDQEFKKVLYSTELSHMVLSEYSLSTPTYETGENAEESFAQICKVNSNAKVFSTGIGNYIGINRWSLFQGP